MSGEPISYTLPSGRTITLRLPTLGDSERLLRRLIEEYKDLPNGMTRAYTERPDLVRRDALLSDSGAKNGALDPDPRHRCADWDLVDAAAYNTFYAELTTLLPEEEEAARAAAKSVRTRLRGGA
jgi:hypothetical protein